MTIMRLAAGSVDQLAVDLAADAWTRWRAATMSLTDAEAERALCDAYAIMLAMICKDPVASRLAANYRIVIDRALELTPLMREIPSGSA